MLWLLHELGDGLEWLAPSEARAALGALIALAVTLAFGSWLVPFQRRHLVLERTEKGDSKRLQELHSGKHGTPTMGGLMILVGVLVAGPLCFRPDHLAPWLALGLMLVYGALGLADDWIKLRTERQGIRARTKFRLQVLLALAVGGVLVIAPIDVISPSGQPLAGTEVFVPIFAWTVPLGVFFMVWVAFVATASSNAVNLTDGLDGLAAGTSTLVAATFALLAALAGREDTAASLGLPFVPSGGELSVFAATVAGAGLGFLRFNRYPAKIFMGDTGALALGGGLGILAVLVKLEILLVTVGGVLVAEALSVVLQVASFRLTGRRIFRIAPLHHHFQFLGWHETRITRRFWLAGAILALGTLWTLDLLSTAVRSP